MPQKLPFPGPGAVVRVRGDSWRVMDLTGYDDCALCHLAGIRPSNRGTRRTLLLPFDRPVPTAPAPLPVHAGRRAWVAAIRGALADAIASTGLRSGALGRFDLLPYQLEPALACVRGETRLLLADEVGLGKTVQAALVLAELSARQQALRALVLAPAGLCAQWVAELRERFRLPASHVDAASLRRLAAVTPPGVTAWLQLPLAVTSFDFLKQPEVLAAVAGLRWDALVIDEAHMVALAPERSRLVRQLARRSRRVILLTATPHAADSDGFRALCDLGRLPGEPPIVLFRRTRASLGLARTRRAHILRVRLSAAERKLHRALERYTSTVWRESVAAASSDARLAMVVLRKRAASGPASLEASLARRLRWLSSSPDPEPAGMQLRLPIDEESADDRADEEPGEVLAAPGMLDAEAERRRLSALLDLARLARPFDGKLRVLERLLHRAGESAIVFTEYRDTLTRLAERLATRTSVAVVHGGLDQSARRRAVADFTSGRVRLLLATDAAAHGLNLQACCRLVIDVDLPWMPSRLEQRIGRVDRIGQQRVVHAVHLVARGTAEEQVLARLVLRIGRERAELGYADNPLGAAGERAAAGEMAVAHMVFGYQRRAGAPRQSTQGTRAEGGAQLDGVRQTDLGGLAEEERHRLERVRQMVAAAHRGPLGSRRKLRGPTPPVGPRWAVVRRRRRLALLPPGLVCLFTARFIDDRYALVEEAPIALHVRLAPALLGRRVLAASLPSLLTGCRARLEALARSVAAGRLDALRERLASHLAPCSVREAGMLASVAGGGAPLQPGLFDLRAVKLADERRRLREQDESEAASRLHELSRAARVELATDPELLLVLGIAL